MSMCIQPRERSGSGSQAMPGQEIPKQVRDDRNAVFSTGNLIVSEGFNPFIEKTHYQAQELYTVPLVRIFGQTGALFIIAEINGELSIIDQHAAHERVIYDRLKRGYER